jgi:magnesium-transporting ATPase (P-type)
MIDRMFIALHRGTSRNGKYSVNGILSEGKTAYADALVRGGEAAGVVRATGTRTFFGKTAELVRTAHAANRQEQGIVRVVRDLFVLNAGLIVIVFGVAHLRGMTLAQMLPLVLTILLASIPVALPATLTLPGRSVSATREPPLLDLAAQPRNVLVHVLRVRKH